MQLILGRHFWPEPFGDGKLSTGNANQFHNLKIISAAENYWADITEIK